MRRRFSGAIAKPCVNVKRSRKATICQTWKIPACGTIIKPCGNIKRSREAAICHAAKIYAVQLPGSAGMSNAAVRRATCQTWKIPACGAIVKLCGNAKRSREAAICQAAGRRSGSRTHSLWSFTSMGFPVRKFASLSRGLYRAGSLLSRRLPVCALQYKARRRSGSRAHSLRSLTSMGFPVRKFASLSRGRCRAGSLLSRRLPVCALHYKARRRRQGLSAQHDVFSAWGRFSPCHPDRDAALRESLRCHPAAGTARRWRASGGWWPSRSR